jgi:hypothetical protein
MCAAEAADLSVGDERAAIGVRQAHDAVMTILVVRLIKRVNGIAAADFIRSRNVRVTMRAICLRSQRLARMRKYFPACPALRVW